MIKVRTSSKCYPEKKYVLDVLLGDFLGLDYQLEIGNSTEKIGIYELEIENGNKIIFQDYFFDQFAKDGEYLNKTNIPQKFFFGKNNFIVQNDIPIIFGNAQVTESSDGQYKIIFCHIDIFASSFFMLSRWEEVVNEIKDQHGRFSVTESLAYKNGFLERPVVNEYVEMLWNMLIYLGCKQSRKERKFKVELTHDVDCPFLYAMPKSFWRFVKFTINEARHGKLFSSIKQPFLYFLTKLGRYTCDPFYTFPYILALSERYGYQSTFFFMVGYTDKFDGVYYWNFPEISKLLREINLRGHEIGLHGSYQSFNNRDMLFGQVRSLSQALVKNDIIQKVISSRQHYLRFDANITPSLLERVGISFDTTLSYADHIGFRCGTCYEYSLFDLKTKSKLNVQEKPLIVMECSMLNRQYMSLSHRQALLRIQKLIDTCKMYHGNFVLLWHNTYLVHKNDRWLYEKILSYASSRT